MEPEKPKLKNLVHDKPVHERAIEIRSYPLDDGLLLVEGRLKDDQLTPGYRWDGKRRSAGTVHRMCVRILVGEWPLKILDAEAEMEQVPHELCPSTEDSVRKIIGVTIAAGFSNEVRKRLGGIRGCAHMTFLVMALGPAAMHGFWTMKSKTRNPLPKSLEEFSGLSALMNSCALWRKEGPMIRHIREKLRR
jgi:hypothetical protein